MLFGPGFAPVDPYILDRYPLRHAFAVHRDGDPLLALDCFDLVAVAPAMFVILHIVIEYK